MSKRSISPEQHYASIVEELTNSPTVTLGSGRKGFGASALCVNGKIFAMLAGERFVVKLPKGRVDALIESGDGERFDPGHGRLMKEWLSLDPASKKEWTALANEALEFVGAKR